VKIEIREDGRKTCPFDHHSLDYAESYPDIYRQLREAGSIVWSDSYGGFWIATNYEYIRKVLMDPAAFSVEPFDNMKKGGIHIPTPERAQRRPRFVPGEADGATHDNARSALNPHFSRRRVEKMRDLIGSRVDHAFERVIPMGEFDIVYDLASPIVAGIVNDHMGLELDDPAAFFRACFAMTGGSPTADNSERLISTFAEAWDYLGKMVKSRREDPREDVISSLLQSSAPKFTDEQVQSMILNVILGAADTTSALAAHTIILLADEPELRERLRLEPDTTPALIEECLRFFNVSMGIARTALREVELDGMIIRPGDRILAPLPAANLDPAKYDHAQEFDLKRGAAQQIGMGVGSHFCLGSWLAKALVAAIVQALLSRVAEYRVNDIVPNNDKANINNFVRARMRIVSIRNVAEAKDGVS
jgi:cytochrome P450